MSVGLGLIKALVKSGRPVTFLHESGVKREELTGKEADAYDYIVEHVASYGSLPNLRTIEEDVGVRFKDYPDEPIGYWIDSVTDRSLSKIILSCVQDVRELVSAGKTEDARGVIRDAVMAMDKRDPIDKIVDLKSVAEDVINRHDKIQKSGNLGGIPFGIDYLDRISGGAQGGDVIVIVGRPGVGKSMVLLKFALNAQAYNKVPMLVTLEMTAFQQARRALALRSNVPATLLRLGRLNKWARDKLVADVASMPGGTPFLFVHGSMSSTVEDLVLRVREYKPDALYADGAYLLKTSTKTGARWERTTETAEVVKRIATDFNIPVFATYQFNRKGPGLGNIAGSDAVGQLGSIVLGMEDEIKEGFVQWRAIAYKLMTLLKGREGERGSLRMLYDMERMLIEQDSVVSGYTYGED